MFSLAMPEPAPPSTALPEILPIFPLTGVLLLPGGRLPLNIFEPRYLAMTRDAMEGERLIGMVQPSDPPICEMNPAYPPDWLRRPHHQLFRDRGRTDPDHAHRGKVPHPRRAAAALRLSPGGRRNGTISLKTAPPTRRISTVPG